MTAKASTSSQRRLRTRYVQFSVLSVAATGLAAALIWRDGPAWGIAATLLATAAGAVGIHRTANQLAADSDPSTVTTPGQACALYFARDRQAKRVFNQLNPTSTSEQRAAGYRALADLVEDMAVVYRLVEADEQTAVEVQRDHNDEVRLLHTMADVEQARAASGLRRPRRPWPALEQHAGDLLDTLADRALAGATVQARRHIDLAQRLIDTGVVAGDGAEVLVGISCTYDALEYLVR